MVLLDVERDVVRLCFGCEPGSALLERLGDARIWALYREMVRNRLRKELSSALRRTRSALGDARFERLFEEHLATAPPRARPFHCVVGDFAAFAEPALRAADDVPPHAADLLAYEAARWAVGDLPDDPGCIPEELDFEREVVLTPALRLLSLGHAVHEGGTGPTAEANAPEARDARLCVYRAAAEAKASTLSLNGVTFALMRRFQAGGCSVTRAVQEVAQERAFTVDDAFVEGLCSVLADFVERGIVLGTKPGKSG